MVVIKSKPRPVKVPLPLPLKWKRCGFEDNQMLAQSLHPQKSVHTTVENLRHHGLSAAKPAEPKVGEEHCMRNEAYRKAVDFAGRMRNGSEIEVESSG